MRTFVLTAVTAGFVGLSAGVWLKSTVLATAAAAPQPSTVTISIDDLMRGVPADMPMAGTVDMV
ncbi:MAG: hypothetical protein FJX62_08590 [Alphaproteobacteria bacterium]|nr:hypothetical protein [Alphaproteobacteria bacterium]